MRCLVLLPLASLAALPARAQDAPQRIEVDLKTDGIVTGALGIGWIGSELLKSHLGPASCRWCSVNLLDETVARVAAWKDIEAAWTVADVTGFAVAPVVTGGVLTLAASGSGRLREMPANGLLMLEAATASALLNQAVKFAAGRERPFVADLPPAEKSRTRQPSDNNVSFYSGHSAFVFALAVSAGTMAHLRGYEGEPYVWGVGVPLAAFVAYTRLAGKKHYLTDVMVGCATGAAFGVAIPLLHRTRAPTGTSSGNLVLSPSPPGVSLAGTW
jgi:membrane-associated phospholipid phosphatase